MPYGGSYPKDPFTSVPMNQRRPAAKTVSYNNTKRTPSVGSTGKFGGLPKGPSGGTMNTGGKRRPGRVGQS